MYSLYVRNGDLIDMSFWSKLGLIDRELFLSIQSEIMELRQENKALSEKNRMYLEEIINLRTSEFEKSNEAEIEKIKENIFALSKQISEVQERILNFEKIVTDGYELSNQKIETVFRQLADGKRTILEVQESFFKDTSEEVIRKIDILDNEVKEAKQECQEQDTNGRSEVVKEISYLIIELKEQLSHIQVAVEKSGEVSLDNGTMINANVKNLKKLLDEASHISEKGSELDKISSDIKLLSESLKNLWTIMKAIWIDSVLTDVDEAL